MLAPAQMNASTVWPLGAPCPHGGLAHPACRLHLRVRRRGLDGGGGDLVVSSHACSGRCAQYYWDWFACAVICFFRVISSQKPHCSTILPFSSR